MRGLNNVKVIVDLADEIQPLSKVATNTPKKKRKSKTIITIAI